METIENPQGADGFMKRIELNGTSLDFIRETNPYRSAGVRIPMTAWDGHLKEIGNRLIISLE